MLKQVLLVSLCYALATVNGQHPCLGAPENPHSFAASPISCAHYTICMNGETITGENLVCPPGMLFDPASEICGQTSCLECSPFGVQNLPHPDDCVQFVECIMGHREVRACPNGLIFDRTLGNCNRREDAYCPNDPDTPAPWEPTTPYPSDPTTPPPWEVTTPPPWEVTTPPPWEVTTPPPWEVTTPPPWEVPTTPTPPPSGELPICRVGGQVHHAHPTDCTRFFLCVNTVLWGMQCPNDLHWNQVVNTCDRPEDAGCLAGPTAAPTAPPTAPPGGTPTEPTLFPPEETTWSTWSPGKEVFEPESPALSDTVVEYYADAEPVPED